MQSLLLRQINGMTYDEKVGVLRAVLAALSDFELGTAIELARQEEVRRQPAQPLPDKLFS